jgi:hypothetical protein
MSRMLAALRALVHRLRTPADADSPYALDPLDEQFATAPRVVAGQDLDDMALIAEVQAAYARYRAGEDIYAGARHEPSPEVRQ